ncbi:hypothetical protein [Nocardia jinanensis]|uniref:Uncharacterized protein n=1 Tax=Nocardia jinanensis TaxID=382504 RepID=A0A917RGL4_9NOCA|nr:hypothetical protein [Nocardia jinanensis]GGL07239.1 hypothetical protein GCM10011588_22140 [Nocardia jinanensis]
MTVKTAAVDRKTATAPIRLAIGAVRSYVDIRRENVMKRIQITTAAVAVFATISVGMAGTANAEFVSNHDSQKECKAAMAAAIAHPAKKVTRACYSWRNGPQFPIHWSFRYDM